MAIPPQTTLFFLDEPQNNFKDTLLKRGLPSNRFVTDINITTQNNIPVRRYAIINANIPSQIRHTNIPFEILLIYNCTSENLRELEKYYYPEKTLLFKNDISCLEYLYGIICQAIYGAIIDFDEEDLLEISQYYRSENNKKFSIISCCDEQETNTVPNNKTVFFSNVVNSYDYAHNLLTSKHTEATLSNFKGNSFLSLIITPHTKNYQKVFWFE